MVYVVVELANVSLKTKASPFLISHQCATHIKHTLVYSTTFNASIGIFNEQVHPMLTQHVNHAMMNDTVGKRMAQSSVHALSGRKSFFSCIRLVHTFH